MTIKPKDNYLVTIENKYVEEIITKSGIKLFVDTGYNPAFHVTVIGKIESIPHNNSLGLKLNEEIFFSYVVIGERNYAASGNVFHSLLEQHVEIFQKYKNGK